VRAAFDQGAHSGSACFALIPARGGSQGVPGKNARHLAGMPLVAHSIASARASGIFDRVYVSTEDSEISEIAAAYDATVITRPDELAQADTPMAPVVEHALRWRCERGQIPSHIFLLQPTSPLRSPADIREAASILSEGECDAVMAVFEAGHPPQWTLRSDSAGMLRPTASWEQYTSRRQDLPVTYLDGPLYAIETDAFLARKRFLTDRTRFFTIPSRRAIDIDTELDFLFAEFLLSRFRHADAPAQATRDLAAHGRSPR
jgi:CMP-N,N'-diacetyllegionaminic acid synthase